MREDDNVLPSGALYDTGFMDEDIEDDDDLFGPPGSWQEDENWIEDDEEDEFDTSDYDFEFYDNDDIEYLDDDEDD